MEGKRDGFYTTPFTLIHCNKKIGAKKEMENQRQKIIFMRNLLLHQTKKMLKMAMSPTKNCAQPKRKIFVQMRRQLFVKQTVKEIRKLW